MAGRNDSQKKVPAGLKDLAGTPAGKLIHELHTGGEKEVDPGRIQMIPIGKLVTTPENPRVIDEKAAEFEDLVKSITAQGVVQPLLVRPTGTRRGIGNAFKFEIRAGERRFRAAVAAGLKTLPCVVREMSDTEAFDVTFTENAHREDLTPVEEGKAVGILLARHGGDINAVCAAMGRKPTWIAQRLSIDRRLIDGWKKLASSAGMKGKVTARHLELLARIPEPVQKHFLDMALGKQHRWTSWLEEGLPTGEDLADRIQDELRVLSKAPWKLDDATLTKRPACAECPKRSSKDPLLWDSAKTKDDQCLDAKCYEEKVLAATVRAVEKARAKDPDAVLVAGYY
ncbi:MAG TPA: ParB/RepB/Spo0J family partition protein, partial [Sumerlaeia bacterium]|nr:ParB/RepB/Spo0J family partition protein [Sumerlaeia bacterium]